ncbi:MAG: mannose-1-phosphate guanylyltransferase [Piscirickettsiaceae bacterium]|nr:MAG: mannose-1-phosphate guanylyltransferase [Piscirickettsiaceae bacterium]
MKVMLLAAGRGERMGELTDLCPKPLLQVAGKSLIEHHILGLKAQGFKEFVINVAYRGQQIMELLRSGEQWGVNIVYSDEGNNALETGGGLFKALPLLGENHFLVVNADIWTDYPFGVLRDKVDKMAHLVLVPNPSHHAQGDFTISNGQLLGNANENYTYSGIGVYHPKLFVGQRQGRFPLAPLIRAAIDQEQVTGELYEKKWVDVGTPERLQDVERYLIAN